MPIVRILVDGYSLLHSCPKQIAPGYPRHSAHAREELVRLLTDYHDATGIPVSVIFDGAGAPPGTPKNESTDAIEVLYSGQGNTADDLIERAAFRLSAYGEAMVVTDDFAERDTILSVGGVISSCQSFMITLENSVKEMHRQVQRHNRDERRQW